MTHHDRPRRICFSCTVRAQEPPCTRVSDRLHGVFARSRTTATSLSLHPGWLLAQRSVQLSAYPDVLILAAIVISGIWFDPSCLTRLKL